VPKPQDPSFLKTGQAAWAAHGQAKIIKSHNGPKYRVVSIEIVTVGACESLKVFNPGQGMLHLHPNGREKTILFLFLSRKWRRSPKASPRSLHPYIRPLFLNPLVARICEELKGTAFSHWRNYLFEQTEIVPFAFHGL
jgi:hypothetical protein